MKFSISEVSVFTKLGELGFSFTEKMEPFIEGGSWDTYRRFSPTGTVPVLVDEQENIKVWDSLAIVEYLAEKHPEVWPENIQARAWARATTAEMHSGFSAIRNQCNMTVGQRVKLHQISPELQKDINRIDGCFLCARCLSCTHLFITNFKTSTNLCGAIVAAEFSNRMGACGFARSLA